MSTGSIYRWRIASGFCALFAFTVLVGFYVPLHRRQAVLVTERDGLATAQASASARIAQLGSEVEASRAENERLKRELESPKSASSRVRSRIEKLERNLSAQFGRLAQAKMLVVSS